MFYSQFILAKKGPLGTIWIAAHLERKLRKNQVADTDIGVSVDSILSPDVPIALRLSSHLLLGVVRIYSKKVNYLFDDCSEALLKIKQAFRSAAVDLPPEESKAPYHSITMPEAFDLDDFELPDNDLLQGNFVDHHISSREQITLQDTMEGVSYSTSKFGLDERFGDADASVLDLDEEILLCKTRTTESANKSADPGTSISIKLDELSETTAFNSGIMVDHFRDNADLIDSAHAPSTPGLVEEPNLSKASAFDDPLESDYHLVESSMTENAKESTSEHKHEADWFSHDILNSDVIPDPLNSEKASNVPRETEFSSINDQSFELKPSTESLGESEVLAQALENRGAAASEETASVAMEFEKNVHEISGVTDCSKQGLGEISTNGQNSPDVVVALSDEISNDQHTNGSVLLNATEDSGLLKTHEKEGLAGTPFIRPCISSNEQTNPTIPGMYIDIYEQFDAVAIESSWKEETPKLVEVAHSDAELHEPEKMMSAPDGILNENSAVLVDSGPGKLSGNEEGDDGSKMISGKKRSFTESTLTEQSLNSAESSRLVRLKKTAESVPDDDDLLSSILAGRSSVLKVKPTPRLSEVTSMKRVNSASRTGAPKRKILMDDTMVLHGDIIRQQLIDTEDIRRVRKKAPCTRPEISMIQKQYVGDDYFLEPVSIGMSNDLVSLQVRLRDLGQITLIKSDPEGVSNEIVATNEQESRVTPQGVENLESLVKENDDNFRRNDEELNSNDNITKDQAGASNFSEELQPNAAGLEEMSRRNDYDDANSNILGPTPSDIIPDEAKNAAFELDFMNRQAITGDEATGNDKNIDVNIEADHFVADDVLTDAKDREPEYNENSVMTNDFSGQHVDFSYPEVNMQEDDFPDIDGIREQSELQAYDTEFDRNSEQHIHDQDVSKYSPCDIDTEFLNFDDEGDDEQNEKVDDPLPEDQEARFTENTGWSSRTRAVSKYLDTMFNKEAECGRKSLSMEKLLGGKSRKEASRLFFEALVLKTRDHINVVQQNPFGDIIIVKPRSSRRGC